MDNRKLDLDHFFLMIEINLKKFSKLSNDHQKMIEFIFLFHSIMFFHKNSNWNFWIATDSSIGDTSQCTLIEAVGQFLRENDELCSDYKTGKFRSTNVNSRLK